MEYYKNYIDDLLKFTLTFYKNDNLTIHEYINNFDQKNIQICNNIINSPIIFNHINNKYNKNNDKIITPIHQMNELYISALNNKGSDNVFITPHIDGPWGFIPKCICIRLLVGIQGNNNIQTIFIQNNKEIIYNLQKYDIISFDYNRDLHYIKNNTNIQPNNNNRILLKLHYAIIPNSYKYFNNIFILLNHKYNTYARNIFLYSQNPKTLLQFITSIIVNTITFIYAKIFMIKLF